MKVIRIIGCIAILLTLIGTVSAYHMSYSPAYSYARLPYREQTNFFANADITRQTADTSAINVKFLQNNANEAGSFRDLNQQLGTQGYFNSLMNSAESNRGISLADGYNINKEPQMTRKIKVNNPGKKNDFTITETINDGISGNFFKDNRYTDFAKNNIALNQNNFGAQAYNLNNFNEGSASKNTVDITGALNTQASTFKTLKANIGKGDLIILS